MKYIVLINQGFGWEWNEDGPFTKKTAERIAAELKEACRIPTRVVPATQKDTYPPLE